MKNNYLDSRSSKEKTEELKGITTKTEDWREGFESLWEASFDREGDKNTFEYERLKDFIFDQISLAEERGAKKERERIAKKIEKMSHEEYCEAGIKILGKPCNCWKKKVLSFILKKYPNKL